MFSFLHSPTRNEEGSLSVEFVLVIPIFCVLLLGMLEMGNYLFYSVALDGGTEQVVRLVESTSRNSSAQSVNDSAAKSAFLATAPSLDDDSLSIHLVDSGRNDSTYTHHLPSTSTSDETDRLSCYTNFTTTIECDYTYKPLSFLGETIAEEDGNIHLNRTVKVNQSLTTSEWAQLW